MKKLKILLILLACLLNPVYSTEIDNQNFLSNYQNKINHILKNYPQIDGAKLNAHIFDINNKTFLNFLISSSGYIKKDTDLMAMMYFNTFKVDNESSSFCFILYDSKSTLLNGYLKNTLLNYEETTAYLVAHEMAHCIYSHQHQINKVTEKISSRENEQLADMFSIAYFSTIGQKENAVKIIRQNKKLNPNDIHANNNELQEFYILFNALDNISEYNDFEKLFQLTYQLFNKIKSKIY